MSHFRLIVAGSLIALPLKAQTSYGRSAARHRAAGEPGRGHQDGIVVFAPQPGRLLGRRRQATMSGDLMMRGANGELAMQQSYTYTSTLDAVKK